jgi:isoleucyl-tRNA synthetase
MPYAQLHYPFENKELFEKNFPAEFIAEGLDQTRGWFYTLTVLASALFDKPAFKNVIVNGLVLAEDGKKMSKSLKNYTPPDDLMSKHGADALRLTLINSALVKAEDLKFSDDNVKDMVRKALLPWYNAFKFFNTYASVDNWKPKFELKEFTPEHILDQWIFSKLQTLTEKVDENMQEYKLFNVVPALFDFIEDLTNWYIRLNRKRFWSEGENKDKDYAYHTLFFTLEILNKLMAPFTPFLSETLFKGLESFKKSEELSVHLANYPEAILRLKRPALEDAVKRMQEIILLGRQKRIQSKIKVKIPLSSITIIHQDQSTLDEIAKLEGSIKIELNVKEIFYSTEEKKFIKLYALPNAPVLGKKLGKDFKLFNQEIRNLSTEQILKLEDSGELVVAGKKFIDSEILVYREALEGSEALSNRYISINLDCTLTDQLMNEGLAREVINRIQKTRKDLNLVVDARIDLKVNTTEKIWNIIEEHTEQISRETLVNSIERFSDDPQYSYDIEDQKLGITLL